MDSEIKTQEANYQKWGFASTLMWGLVIFLLSGIVQFSTSLVYAKINYGDSSEELLDKLEFDSAALSLGAVATLVICSLALCGIIKLKKNSNLKSYLALNRISLADFIYWGLASLVFIIITNSLPYLLGRPIVSEFMSALYDSTNHFWLFLFALVIAAPVFEELFFRGFVISGLTSTFIGPIGAIILSSLLWASIHLQYDLYMMFEIFIAGLFFGVARLKTNSIFIPILMHSTNNMVSFIVASINASA